MSYSTYIELSQMDAYRVDTAGVYRIRPKKVMVEEGDQIVFEKMLASTPQQDPDNITISPDETAPSITFSYYDVNYDTTDKSLYDKSADWTTQDFEYYGAYNQTNIVQVTNIILKINGYWKPTDEDGNEGWDQAGGSYIIPAPWVQAGYGSIDPTISFYATFSYIDSNGDLQYLTCTNSTNVKKYGTLYGMMSGAEVTVSSGVTVEDGQIVMIPCNNDRTKRGTFPTIKQGTMKLVKVEGGWAGAFISQGGGTSYPSNERGGEAGGASIAGSNPQELQRYDTAGGKPTNPYKLSQFGIEVVQFSGGTGSVQLDVQNASFTLEAGTYTKQSLAVTLTQLLSNAQGLKPAVAGLNQVLQPNNPFIVRTDDSTNANMFFRKIDFDNEAEGYTIDFDNTNSYFYYDTGTGTPTPYIVGAQQFALEWTGATQAFQMSYMHTPLQQVGSPNDQLVGIYHTGSVATNDLRYYQVTSATGIVIHDMQPRSLWQDQLGLADRLIVPLKKDSNGIRYYNRSDMINKITYGFLGLDGFPTKGTVFRKQPVPPTDNPTYLDVTGNSRAIIGETPSPEVAGGAYQVRLTGLTRQLGTYSNANEDRNDIVAVVSNYNENQGIVTGYSSDGVSYTHYGEPYIISDVGVEILAFDTKLPVDGLGNENSVIMKIIKPLQNAQNSAVQNNEKKSK